MRVPEKLGENVLSEVKLIQKVPVFLDLRLREDNGEKTLRLWTVPVRLTEVFIRIKWKVKIFHNGSLIKDGWHDFEKTKERGRIIWLDGTLKGEIEVLMENIAIEYEESKEFDLIRFEMDPPRESKCKFSGYDNELKCKYFVTESLTKDLHGIKFNVQLYKFIFDKGFESYQLSLKAPDLAAETEVDCAILLECLTKDDAPWAGSKLIHATNISRTFSPSKNYLAPYINFDPDWEKVRVTVIFSNIGRQKLSKSAVDVRKEIAKMLKLQ